MSIGLLFRQHEQLFFQALQIIVVFIAYQNVLTFYSSSFRLLDNPVFFFCHICYGTSRVF